VNRPQHQLNLCRRINNRKHWALKTHNREDLIPDDLKVSALLDEHLWYTEQYTEHLIQHIDKLEYFNYMSDTMINWGLILKTISWFIILTITLVAKIYQRFEIKTVFIIVFLGWSCIPAKAAPISTSQGLQNTLAYIRFWKDYAGYNQSLATNNLQKWRWHSWTQSYNYNRQPHSLQLQLHLNQYSTRKRNAFSIYS